LEEIRDLAWEAGLSQSDFVVAKCLGSVGDDVSRVRVVEAEGHVSHTHTVEERAGEDGLWARIAEAKELVAAEPVPEPAPFEPEPAPAAVAVADELAGLEPRGWR
jgi:hypothetical protein